MPANPLNYIIIQNAPSPEELQTAAKAIGRPTEGEIGVLSCSASHSFFQCQLICQKSKTVGVLTEKEELTKEEVDHYQAISWCVWPAQERLEIYSTSKKEAETVKHFIESIMGEHFAQEVHFADPSIDLSRFPLQFRSRDNFAVKRVAGETRNGHHEEDRQAFDNKFTEPDDGLTFIEQNLQSVHEVQLRWREHREGKKRPITVTARPDGRFNITCKDDCRDQILNEVRTLATGGHL